ncbi:hypothetical protein EVAR_57851_1 [Eumeta japonica]|uniref:Uncharacterized protein n=1 Tax=Eumeta variegata TaxID=151549 RepID=A0A4C1YVF9_EUMVA|nr:hypothetical protein EVAR_57851_1 [Eumeta japonica]
MNKMGKNAQPCKMLAATGSVYENEQPIATSILPLLKKGFPFVSVGQQSILMDRARVNHLTSYGRSVDINGGTDPAAACRQRRGRRRAASGRLAAGRPRRHAPTGRTQREPLLNRRSDCKSCFENPGHRAAGPRARPRAGRACCSFTLNRPNNCLDSCAFTTGTAHNGARPGIHKELLYVETSKQWNKATSEDIQADPNLELSVNEKKGKVNFILCAVLRVRTLIRVKIRLPLTQKYGERNGRRSFSSFNKKLGSAVRATAAPASADRAFRAAARLKNCTSPGLIYRARPRRDLAQRASRACSDDTSRGNI